MPHLMPSPISARRAMLGALLWGAVTLALPGTAPAATSRWHDDGPAALRLVSPWEAAPLAEGAAELALGLEVALDPGWHIYWRNSGDAGYPPRLDLSPTPGLSEVSLRFPIPHRYELPGDLVAFGYSERVVYPVAGRLRFGEQEANARLRIAGSVDYVVCASECVPFRTALELEQPLSITPKPEPEGQALLATWSARVPSPAPPGVATARLSERSPAGGTLELSFAALPAPPTDLFFAPHELVELGRPVHRREDGTDRFSIPFTFKVRRDPEPARLVLDWTIALGEGGWTGELEADLEAGLDTGRAGEPSATTPASPRPIESPNLPFGAALPWPWWIVLVVAVLGLVWTFWPRDKPGRRS